MKPSRLTATPYRKRLLGEPETLRERGAMLCEYLPQDGTVAMGLVGAVAPHGKIGPVGQRGKEPQDTHRVWCGHFGSVALHEGGPFPGRPGTPSLREKRSAGRQVREPDVVPVLARVVLLAHATRRMAHGADAKAFVSKTGTTKSNDSDRHPGACCYRKTTPPRNVQ